MAPGISATLIDAEPSGKRVLMVEDKEITSEATGKIILHIDGNDILTNVHDKAILVVDENDVRHSAAGVVLASFDDGDIRHGRNGKVIMNYQHPDICPDARSNRIYRVDGPELTKQQLVAVLYALKPELFKLTEAETAAQQKEMVENGAEADRAAAADQVTGTWELLNGNGPVPHIDKGTITFAAKLGEVYPVTLDYAANGGPQWTGVASYQEINGDKTVWAAYGTAKTIGLCVYEIDGGDLTGNWFPWYADGTEKNTGTEKLQGPATLGGGYKITEAKAPSTGAAYAGVVSVAPLEITGATSDCQPYSVTWKIGDLKIAGIGIRTGNRLFVASGSGPDVNIGKFTIRNGSFTGDFFKLGSTEMGSMAAMKN